MNIYYSVLRLSLALCFFPVVSSADDLWSCGTTERTVQAVGKKKKTIVSSKAVTLQVFPNITSNSHGLMGWIMPSTGLPVTESWTSDSKYIYTSANINTLARYYAMSYCPSAGLACSSFSAGGSGKATFKAGGQSFSGTDKWTVTAYAANVSMNVTFNTTLTYYCNYASHVAGTP
jgi:hypothetical protein